MGEYTIHKKHLSGIAEAPASTDVSAALDGPHIPIVCHRMQNMSNRESPANSYCLSSRWEGRRMTALLKIPMVVNGRSHVRTAVTTQSAPYPCGRAAIANIVTQVWRKVRRVVMLRGSLWMSVFPKSVRA
jgi:hypothetical protein